MSKQIHKSVRECLSKIKISNKQIHIRFRRCGQPRTPSFDIDGNRKGHGDDAVTLSDVDQFLFENFRSLYQEEPEEGLTRWTKGNTTSSYLFECPELLDPPPPENLCRSDRFFVASGSSSSLIMDDKSSVVEELDETVDEDLQKPGDFIVIFTHSPSPYEDFRRSMQEMVEARLERSGKVDWGFLEELLFCYLDLNNKKSYRYILRAFVDLIVVLRKNTSKSRRTRKGRGGRRLK